MNKKISEKSVCQRIDTMEFLMENGRLTASLKRARKFPMYAEVPKELGKGYRMMSVYALSHV